MICEITDCEIFYETFAEEKCELCHKRVVYMADQRRLTEKRKELANLDKEIELEKEIERKRAKLGGQNMFQRMWSGLLTPSLAQLRRRHVDTKDQKGYEYRDGSGDESEEACRRKRRYSIPSEEQEDVEMSDMEYEACDGK